MRAAVVILSILGLVLIVAPSVFVFYGVLSWKIHAQLMFAGMLLWFVFAPVWMRRREAGGH